MRDLFGRNFVFRPVFLSVLPAEAGIFAVFSLFQKCGLGKVLSVNDLLRLFELKFLRIMRVNGGGDRTAQRVPRPDADDFAQNACFLAATYKGVLNQVKAKGTRPERRLLRALRTHCNTTVGIAASSIAPIHRKMRSFRVQSNRKRVDRRRCKAKPAGNTMTYWQGL